MSVDTYLYAVGPDVAQLWRKVRDIEAAIDAKAAAPGDNTEAIGELYGHLEGPQEQLRAATAKCEQRLWVGQGSYTPPGDPILDGRYAPDVVRFVTAKVWDAPTLTPGLARVLLDYFNRPNRSMYGQQTVLSALAVVEANWGCGTGRQLRFPRGGAARQRRVLSRSRGVQRDRRQARAFLLGSVGSLLIPVVE